MEKATLTDNVITDNSLPDMQKYLYDEMLIDQREAAFDHITELAAGIAGVRQAGIMFNIGGVFRTKSFIGEKISLEEWPLLPENKADQVAMIRHKYGQYLAIVPISYPSHPQVGFIYLADEKPLERSAQQETLLLHLADLVRDKLQTRIAIKKTLTAQDDRLHVLIHDLKNPMTTLSLQAELVNRIPGIDPKAALMASKINTQSKRIVDQMNEILDAARKEHGTFKPQKVKTDLRQLLLSAVQNLKGMADQKKLSFSIAEKEDWEVYADPDKLTEVFYQLLHNAIKFSHPNGIIDVIQENDGSQVTIGIQDHGPGLSASDLEKVFIKFARLKPANTHHENSHQLGLVLARMYVDMHKGKLWAESAGEDQGTTFFIRLPIK